ncbi:hypothetical protein QJS04_geneDACA019538 [Acorus gramineus]|uniref:Uncharacterized protein n=1 Tax=Acorus gramineus TaxID=55184 RepID=A0AAV9AB77_ACOGR|nr:hypothetical protein QJS04_geneDACA019538 [Acorus gramineus]
MQFMLFDVQVRPSRHLRELQRLPLLFQNYHPWRRSQMPLNLLLLLLLLLWADVLISASGRMLLAFCVLQIMCFFYI